MPFDTATGMAKVKRAGVFWERARMAVHFNLDSQRCLAICRPELPGLQAATCNALILANMRQRRRKMLC